MTELVLKSYWIVSLLAVAVGLQVQLLQLQLLVGVGIEPAKASLIYSKMSVMSQMSC